MEGRRRAARRARHLFETGIVDVSLVNDHLARHPLVAGYAETPAWRQLWSWTDLPRSQYLEARDKLVGELRAGDLTHPGVILHAAGIVIRAKTFDDHLLGDGEDVVAFFARYVEHLRTAGKLEPSRDLFERPGRSYAGLGYSSKDSPEFREIYMAVRAATNASFAAQMRGIASTFLDRIDQDPEAYASLHEYGVENGNYADAPLLHYIDAGAFARHIIKDSSPDDRLLASLHARYERETHHHALADEYPWLKALRSALEAIAADAQPPHQHLLELTIKYYFDKIDEVVCAAKATAAASAEREAAEIEDALKA